MSRARMHDPLPDPGEHAMDMDADLHSDGAAESQSTGNTNHYYLANPPLRGPASIRIRPGTYGQESASLSAASRSERGSSMRGREVGSQRSIIGGGGGGGGAEQGSCAPMGVIKVGEVLSKQYDLTTVDPEDRSSVLATIRCIVTLEERVPELDITVNREPGYYAILVRGFDEFIDIVNWHSKVRAAPGRGNKMRLVHNFLGDPGTGILVVRVGMRETGAVTEPGLPVLPSAIADGARKRGRDEATGMEVIAAPASVDYEIARRILDSLRARCIMDDADPADVHRLLTVLYHVTMLDPALPMLEVSPVRRDGSGSYVMTCRGFITKVDFDHVYDRLVDKAPHDDSLRTLLSVAYNTSQAVLEVCVQGNRAVGPTKRRRAALGDGLEHDGGGGGGGVNG
jgi:hypothetical protein